MDFQEDFQLQEEDIVVGIEITLLITSAATDISGVYLIDNAEPCTLVDLGIDRTICSTDSVFLTSEFFENLQWSDGSTASTFFVHGSNLEIGFQEIFVEAQDSNGCISHDTIGITVEKCWSFNNMGYCKNIILYPNPSNEELNIVFAQFEIEDELQIFTYRGRLIETILVSDSSINIDLSNYSDGLYLAKTKYGVCKFVKQ